MERPGFEAHLCHFLAGYLRENHLTLLMLSLKIEQLVILAANMGLLRNSKQLPSGHVS